ncbi:MAG TPA: hypothetical protein VEV84_16715 [Pyrinomonadaceae bacterium]|nr:hypothetical protein [Pyrinomonadaceae bacterium]
MATGTESSDRLRSILVAIATTATIAFNILAATGYVNGVIPKEISDHYPTILTPAAYAFSIWSLIYLGIAVFSVLQLLPPNLARFRNFRTLYIVSCFLNCAWLYFWHYNHPAICLVLMAVLALTLLLLVARFTATETAGMRIAKITFGLYAGWVTVAALVNLFVVFTAFEIGFSGTVLDILGVVAIAAASMIALFVAQKFRNYLFSLAIAWALTAIAINQSGNTAVVVATAIGVIVTLLAALSFIIYLPMAKIPQNQNE